MYSFFQLPIKPISPKHFSTLDRCLNKWILSTENTIRMTQQKFENIDHNRENPILDVLLQYLNISHEVP